MKENLVMKGSHSYTSVFRSSSTRNILNNKDSVAPGTYNVAQSLEIKKPYKEVSSFFVHPLNLEKPLKNEHPLVSKVVHQIPVDAYTFIKDFKLPGQVSAPKKELTIHPSLGALRKPQHLASFTPSAKMANPQKDLFFNGDFHLPRLHAFEIPTNK